MILGLLLISLAGCTGPLSQDPVPSYEEAIAGIEPPPLYGSATSATSPIRVPAVDQELLWSQINDELDDYFKIRRSEQIRIVEDTLTEGWIETYPRTGASILEPWRRDAATPYERWLGTFQSIRRWARVTVVPVDNEFQIEVHVYKELEDLDQPTGTSAGGQVLRHDDSPEDRQSPFWYEPRQYGWIALGRDAALEEKILKNIAARINVQAY